MSFTVSISNRSIPTLHQSAFLLWPSDNNISGATYSVVPHKEFDRLDSSISFARSPANSELVAVFLPADINWWTIRRANIHSWPPSIHSCRFYCSDVDAQLLAVLWLVAERLNRYPSLRKTAIHRG
ncbi:unnamed protein product [Rhodiola kirilowii]